MNILTLNNLSDWEIEDIIDLTLSKGIFLNGGAVRFNSETGDLEKSFKLVNGELLEVQEIEDAEDSDVGFILPTIQLS